FRYGRASVTFGRATDVDCPRRQPGVIGVNLGRRGNRMVRRTVIVRSFARTVANGSEGSQNALDVAGRGLGDVIVSAPALPIRTGKDYPSFAAGRKDH